MHELSWRGIRGGFDSEPALLDQWRGGQPLSKSSTLLEMWSRPGARQKGFTGATRALYCLCQPSTWVYDGNHSVIGGEAF